MNRVKEILLVGLSLLFSIALCLLLNRFDNKYTRQTSQPINGVLSVSDAELSQENVYFLTREWLLFPGVLLLPNELADYNGYRCYTDIGGSNGTTHGSNTYQLTLMLPEHERTYALELPEIFSACQLYINGSLFLELGNLSPEHYSEGITSRILPFEASGRTELLLRTSDFSGMYSGMTYPPAFGLAQTVLQMREIRLLLHGGAVLLALLGMSLAFAFGVRGNWRRGLLCGLICICLLGIVGYPLVHDLQITGFQPWYTIEIGCFYGLLLLAVLLQCELYGLRIKKTLVFAAPCALGFICALLRAVGAAYWNVSIGLAFSALSFFLKYYAAACLTGLSCWALWGGKRYSISLMCASAMLSVCLVCDRILPLYEPIYGGWFGEVGGVLMTVTLGAALWMDALGAYRFRLTYEDGYRQMQERLVMQKEHYQQLSEQIQHSREATHDLRHHMRTLRGIAVDGQLDRLISYLDSYEPHLAEREITVWSDHPAADAVIGHYAASAKLLDVIYDVRLAIPPNLSFPDDELCILLGNLLENAIEALARQKIGQRRLYLRGDFIHGRMGLVLDNSFDGVLKQRDGKYISMKHGGFGLGVSSVRAIAEKYGGLADFSAEEHTFHASVMIPVAEPVVIP